MSLTKHDLQNLQPRLMELAVRAGDASWRSMTAHVMTAMAVDRLNWTTKPMTAR